MAKSQAAIAIVSEKLPPDRAALAAALVAVTEARKAVAAARAAEERGAGLVAAAEAEVDRAELDITGAKARHGAAMTEAAKAGTPPPPAAELRSARAAHGDALDQLDAAREARAAVKAALSDAHQVLWEAELAVKPAESAILRSVIPRLLAEIEADRAALVGKYFEIIWLKREINARRGRYDNYGSPEENDAFRVLNYATTLPNGGSTYWPGWKEIEAAATAPWAATLEALAVDPGTELPR